MVRFVATTFVAEVLFCDNVGTMALLPLLLLLDVSVDTNMEMGRTGGGGRHFRAFGSS